MEMNIVRMRAVGLFGVAMLFIGCFSPLFHLPIVGSVSFIGNGQGDGIFVLALATIAAVLLSIRAHAWVLGPAVGATIISAITLVKFVSGMASVRTSLAGEMKDNPFGGLASALVQNISLEWGWALLLIGLLCLFAAAGAAFSANGAQEAVHMSHPLSEPPPVGPSRTVQPSQPDAYPGLSATRRSSFGRRR